MGSYVNSNLMAGESIVYQGKVSKVCVVTFGVLSVILTLLLAIFIVSATSNGGTMSSAILAVVVAIIDYKAVKWLIDCLTSEFAITDKRCILKRGLVSPTVADMMLDKCDGIVCKKKGMGVIFGYGRITATTGSTIYQFDGISSPETFRNKLAETIEDYKHRS